MRLIMINLLILSLGFGLFACEAAPADPEIPLPTPGATATAAAAEVQLYDELIAAAEQGDVAAVERLLAAGADIEATDMMGRTPLIAAAYENHLEVARLLIAAGADVNVQDRTRQSAYLIATSDGYLELLQMTLAAGADVHRTDSFNGTGLIRAADRGHVAIIAELLKTDIEVDHINNLGWTALLEAIILGDGGERHTEVVRLLVEAGADVSIADGQGITPAEHAHRRGYDEILEILTSQPGQPPFLTPTPHLPPGPTATPGPLHTFTIPALQTRSFVGGEIEVRRTMAETELFTQYDVSYPSDELTITGLMYVPAGPPPFPVLILLHGYIDRANYVAGADTWQAAEFFASQDYLVLAPDLRSWGESDSGLSLFHMGLVVDVLNLIGSVPSIPEADPAHIGLWGHSMGGGLATKLLTIDNRVGAALLYAPNSADDADLIERWGAGCPPGISPADGAPCNPAEIIPADTSEQIVAAYQAAAGSPDFLQQIAPIYHLGAITAPIQIHIGTADGQGLSETPPEWSLALAEALQAANREVYLFTYDGQGHFFTGASWTQLLERALSFYDAELKPDL